MLQNILVVAGSLAALIALLVLFAALKPNEFRVARSRTIAASPSALFPRINDLHRFQDWSPYRERDPQAINEFTGPPAGPGAKFRWSGNNNVGEGSMTIKETVPDRLVRVDLEFVRPFKGQNVVDFTLEPSGRETNVTWAMTGQYVLASKIVGLFINMDRMIGGDFEQGLAKLKTLAEADARA